MGTFANDSDGTLMLVMQFSQMDFSHNLHTVLRGPKKRLNSVFKHVKQILPFSSPSLNSLVTPRDSSSAFVRADLMCCTSSRVRVRHRCGPFRSHSGADQTELMRSRVSSFGSRMSSFTSSPDNFLLLLLELLRLRTTLFWL